MTKTTELPKELKGYAVQNKPFYIPVGNEIELFSAAYKQRLPILLKGPTGCGKTRFVEYMAYELGRPLFTVSCHEDLTANDLIGRLVLKGGETEFVKGPLTLAVECGGIAYLDEIVEARKDTIVAIHPLTDHRRQLPIEKLQTVLGAHSDFLLVCSYNPGYQSIVKDLKQSTKQRFVSIAFVYPNIETEVKIIRGEAGITVDDARALVRIGHKVRNLKDKGLEEGASTRVIVDAAKLVEAGLDIRVAVRHAIAQPITDDSDIQKSIEAIVDAILGGKE